MTAAARAHRFRPRARSRRRAHKLEQVLDAGFAAFGLLALVVIEEPAVLQHVIHLLKERQVVDFMCRALDERHEALHGDGCLRPERVSDGHCGGLPQRSAGGLGLLADDVEALGADAAGRQVHHTLK